MTNPTLSVLRAMAKGPRQVQPIRDIREHISLAPQVPPSLELLEGMTLSGFRASGLVVVAFIPELGEAVVWAADNTPTARLAMDEKGRVVYHGEELRLLTLLGPDDLRAYHALRLAAGDLTVESLTIDTLNKEGAA